MSQTQRFSLPSKVGAYPAMATLPKQEGREDAPADPAAFASGSGRSSILPSFVCPLNCSAGIQFGRRPSDNFVGSAPHRVTHGSRFPYCCVSLIISIGIVTGSLLKHAASPAVPGKTL